MADEYKTTTKKNLKTLSCCLKTLAGLLRISKFGSGSLRSFGACSFSFSFSSDVAAAVTAAVTAVTVVDDVVGASSFVKLLVTANIHKNALLKLKDFRYYVNYFMN